MIMRIVSKKQKAAKKAKGGKIVKSKLSLRGSYTVEAAYIIPLLFLLIFMIMSYAFFFHGSIISDAWVAHLAEEERMAVSYGKIPFDSGIYLEGFNDEEGFINARLLMSESLEKHCDFLIAGRAERAELSFSDDEVSAEIRFFMNGLNPYADAGDDYDGIFTGSRSIYNPQKYARITKGVYRFAKKSILK